MYGVKLHLFKTSLFMIGYLISLVIVNRETFFTKFSVVLGTLLASGLKCVLVTWQLM